VGNYRSVPPFPCAILDLMTPEERWTRLENLVQTLVDNQVHLQATQQETSEQIKAMNEQLTATQKLQQAADEAAHARGVDIDRRLARLADLQEQTEVQLQALTNRLDRVVERVEKIEKR
jgi:hypothetical protein